MRRRHVWVVLAVVAVCGCGSGNDHGEDLGNLIERAQGPHSTRESHPDGWQRRECFACHPLEDIHQVDRSGTGVLPVAEIRKLVARERLASCVRCHGDNGVGQ